MWPFTRKKVDPYRDPAPGAPKPKPRTGTTLNGEHLTDEEMHRMLDPSPPVCPDCGAGLLEGPHGGLSVNVYCSNDKTCGSRFNVMGPFGVDRITDKSPFAGPIN
jgi:hypothetical protein